MRTAKGKHFYGKSTVEKAFCTAVHGAGLEERFAASDFQSISACHKTDAAHFKEGEVILMPSLDNSGLVRAINGAGSERRNAAIPCLKDCRPVRSGKRIEDHKTHCKLA
jgi:hypothetical protein